MLGLWVSVGPRSAPYASILFDVRLILCIADSIHNYACHQVLHWQQWWLCVEEHCTHALITTHVVLRLLMHCYVEPSAMHPFHVTVAFAAQVGVPIALSSCSFAFVFGIDVEQPASVCRQSAAAVRHTCLCSADELMHMRYVYELLQNQYICYCCLAILPMHNRSKADLSFANDKSLPHTCCECCVFHRCFACYLHM